MRIIDEFCDAYAEWDTRSNVGDVYLTPIMQFFGSHVRRGNDPHELAEYTVDDLRHELHYLAGELQMDAAFLVVSLIRAVDVELVETSVAYGESLGNVRQQKAAVDQIFDQYAGPLDARVLEGMRDVLDSAWRLHDEPAHGLRRDQQRVVDWRKIMAPIIDRENRVQAYAEQWGEPE